MGHPRHLTPAELAAGIADALRSPRDAGELVLIVRRPTTDAREELDVGELTPEAGLVGDMWATRRCPRTPDGAPHPDMQLALMNARVAAWLACDPARVALAGDQLFVDLDLSEENLPAGTRLRLGGALLEVTSQPHTGCAKFGARFGSDALAFISARERAALRLRGLYCRVVHAGVVRRGDPIARLVD